MDIQKKQKARTDLDEKYIVNPGDLVFSWSGKYWNGSMEIFKEH